MYSLSVVSLIALFLLNCSSFFFLLFSYCGRTEEYIDTKISSEKGSVFYTCKGHWGPDSVFSKGNGRRHKLHFLTIEERRLHDINLASYNPCTPAKHQGLREDVAAPLLPTEAQHSSAERAKKRAEEKLQRNFKEATPSSVEFLETK